MAVSINILLPVLTSLSFLLLTPTTTASFANDPPSHVDLNPFYGNIPGSFFSGAVVRKVNSPESLMSAFQPTVASETRGTTAVFHAFEGVDVVKLDFPCSRLQQNVLLAAAVVKMRFEGVVVLCQGDRIPIFVDTVHGGLPMTISLLFRNGGPAAAVRYRSVVSPTSDLEIGAPDIVDFEKGGQIKKISLTVRMARRSGTGDGGGRMVRKGRIFWRGAHIDWVSTADRGSVRWVVIIRNRAS